MVLCILCDSSITFYQFCHECIQEFRKPGEVEEEVQEVTEKTAHVHVGHHKRERRHSEKEREVTTATNNY